jgi:hypothetical protein
MSLKASLEKFREQLSDLPVWRHHDRLMGSRPDDVPVLIKGYGTFYNQMDSQLWSAAVISLLYLRNALQDGANIQLADIHISRAAGKSIQGWARDRNEDKGIHYAANQLLLEFLTLPEELGLSKAQNDNVKQYLQRTLKEPLPTDLADVAYKAALYRRVPEILIQTGNLRVIPTLAQEVGVRQLYYPYWGDLPNMRYVNTPLDNGLASIRLHQEELKLDVANIRGRCATSIYADQGEAIRNNEYTAAVTLLALLSFIEGWIEHVSRNR